MWNQMFTLYCFFGNRFKFINDISDTHTKCRRVSTKHSKVPLLCIYGVTIEQFDCDKKFVPCIVQAQQNIIVDCCANLAGEQAALL